METGRTYCADLGNGTYLNPLMHGEYPDPSILKDGADYYMVNCSQSLLWHSEHWTKTLNSTNIDHVSNFVFHSDGGASLLPALFTYGNGCVTYHSFEITELPEEDPEPEEWEY